MPKGQYQRKPRPMKPKPPKPKVGKLPAVNKQKWTRRQVKGKGEQPRYPDVPYDADVYGGEAYNEVTEEALQAELNQLARNFPDVPECEVESLRALQMLPDQSQRKVTLQAVELSYDAIVELHRVLKPNGKLVISLPPPKDEPPYRKQGEKV